ncbi:MAG: hypothetical protein ACRCSV_00975 [Chlamydiales bacterium]
MNVYGLRIFEDKHTIVCISLIDILDVIPNKNDYNWAILFLDATGDLRGEKSLLSLEEEIKKAKNGLYITWDEIHRLFPKFDQVIDLDLIGCTDKSKLHRYDNDKEMYESCDIVIRMVDTSYWEIYSHAQSLLQVYKKKFLKTESINMKVLKDLK